VFIAQFNGREIEGDDQQEREALRAIGKFRVQNSDDLDLNNLSQRHIQHSSILAFVRIE
jgi:hypothetical protein